MKWPAPKLLLSLLSLALVLLLFALDTQRTSPGELSPVHARIAELAGSAGCDRCHGGFARSMRSACLDCHATIADSIEHQRGLHGTQDTAQCERCHVEHHGDDLEIAGARAFALAGIPERERYDHADLGFALAGKHLELGCAKCHANADVAVLQAGEPRFQGLAQDCASCHEDPHQGRMTRACADCHGQSEPFTQVAAFDHGGVFDGRGAHARAACVDCHPRDGAYSVEAQASAKSPPPARGCEQCHASPHAPDFIAASAAQLAQPAGSTCGACHDPAGGAFRDARPPRGIDWHAASGFALSAPHAELACASCHTSALTDGADAGEALGFAQRHPGRSADDCAACHADPHAGQFAASRLGSGNCLDCHQRTHFAPSRIDANAHARSAFALEGAHVRLDCGQCHVADASLAGEALRFVGTPQACAACHEDPHGEQFAGNPLAAQGCVGCHDQDSFVPSSFGREQHARTSFALDGAHAATACGACHLKDPARPSSSARFTETPTACAGCHADSHQGRFSDPSLLAEFPALVERGCAACHDTQSFAHGARERFDHASLAGFVVDGAHARAGCESCHAPSAQADASGRRFGRVAALFRGPVGECATCHADVHGGSFDRVDSPQSVRASRASARAPTCDRCHTSERFDSPEARAFDHGAWTAFALEGAHRRMGCESCHPKLPAPTADGRSFARVEQLFRGPYARCSACHADPHNGHFDRPGTPASIGGANSCARCHTQDSFEGAAAGHFDHGLWTGFVLEGAHAQSACVACHTPGAAALAAGRGLGRVPGSACQDCHSDPHAGQFLDDAGSNCAACHDPSGSFADEIFDHQRDSRFALDKDHAKLACGACHLPVATASGTRAVRYKPLGTKCVDCHGLANPGRGSGKGG